jgi:hypothetical protein
MNKILFIGFWLLTLVVSYWIGLKSDSVRDEAQGNDLATLSSSKPSLTKPSQNPITLFPKQAWGDLSPMNVSFEVD